MRSLRIIFTRTRNSTQVLSVLSLPHRVVRTALEMSLFVVILVQPEVRSKLLGAAGGADNRFRRVVSAGVRHERLQIAHRVGRSMLESVI